jgi:hypothetical protein
MGRSLGKIVEMEARIEHVTEFAYLVEPTIGEQFWLPKSQVVDRTDPDMEGLVVFHITEWIAEKKGLL